MPTCEFDSNEVRNANYGMKNIKEIMGGHI